MNTIEPKSAKFEGELNRRALNNVITQPILTIVTVTMNCAETISRTLLSVQAIKEPSVEYIVIDGASTDGTLAIINRYSDFVDTVISESDTGIYNAMNKGAMLAKGKYILFINGDDELLSQGFSSVLRSLHESEADIFCATTLVGNATHPTETLKGVPRNLPFFNSIPHPSSFVSTSLMRLYPFREDLRIASDYDFFLRAFVEGRRFSILPEVTALHARGGASGDVQKSLAEVSTVRRERLSWRYPIVCFVATMYWLVKPFFRWSKQT